MDRIEIKSIAIKNYRNIDNCAIDLTDGPVGVVGVNAAGKTNIGRGIIFFFGVLQNKSNPAGAKPGKPHNDASPSSDLRWNPLDVEPNAVLANPAPGQVIEFEMTCTVPFFLLPEEQGHVLRQLQRRKEACPLSVSIAITCDNLPNGDVRLVPSFNFLLDNRGLAHGDIAALQPLWKLFKGTRIQAMQPASESLTALSQLQQKNAAGLRAFNRLNKLVQSLDPNFAPISFISSGPIAVEGEISDLVPDNMSSGNLKAVQILSASKNPDHEKLAFLHIEEPEAHFHPSLQRSVVRELLAACRDTGIATIIETHSPHVVAELYHHDCPVYRVDVVQRDSGSHLRRSRVIRLSDRRHVETFMECLGYEGAFAVLG
ncbi:MAG: ATP-binding protein, partial [Verrucomicrobia bacterium]|nr:ATP-binding protein [Verrucomicrobiota bacterium]